MNKKEVLRNGSLVDLYTYQDRLYDIARKSVEYGSSSWIYSLAINGVIKLQVAIQKAEKH